MTNRINAPGGWWRMAGRSIVAAVVFVPLVALRLTGEVDWTLGDFVFAAVMLGGTWVLLETVVESSAARRRKIVWSAVIVLALLAVWVELAVGIFD